MVLPRVKPFLNFFICKLSLFLFCTRGSCEGSTHNANISDPWDWFNLEMHSGGKDKFTELVLILWTGAVKLIMRCCTGGWLVKIPPKLPARLDSLCFTNTSLICHWGSFKLGAYFLEANPPDWACVQFIVKSNWFDVKIHKDQLESKQTKVLYICCRVKSGKGIRMGDGDEGN